MAIMQREHHDGGEAVTAVTVLIGVDQRAAIDDLRRRSPDGTEAAFWSVVLGDGIALFDYQLWEDEQGEAYKFRDHPSRSGRGSHRVRFLMRRRSW